MKCIQMCHFFSFLSRKIVIFCLGHRSVVRVVNFGGYQPGSKRANGNSAQDNEIRHPMSGKKKKKTPTGSRHNAWFLTLVIGFSFIVVKVCFSPHGTAPFCRSSCAIANDTGSIANNNDSRRFISTNLYRESVIVLPTVRTMCAPLGLWAYVHRENGKNVNSASEKAAQNAPRCPVRRTIPTLGH